MDTPTPSTDHDLLIEVSTNVKNLSATITASTLATTQVTNDHEHRLRVVESFSQQLEGGQKSQSAQLKVVGIVFGLITLALSLFTYFKH